MGCRRVVNTLLSCALMVFALQSSAEAAIIPTGSLVAPPTAPAPDLPSLATRLERLGVPPETARLRVSALTRSERVELARRLDGLPAGGDAIGALAFVGLVLLLTDVLGLTDVYPFVTHTINGEKPRAARGGDCPPAATASAQP